MLTFDVATAITVTGFVLMIGMTAWGMYFSYRGYQDLRQSLVHAQIELQRGTRELRREVDEGLAELKRLDIVIGGMVYQEDEKTRALITARFDEMLARLPR